MPRLKPIERESAPETTQKLLANVEDKLGMVPNLIATVAQSTSVAGAYLRFTEALNDGVLSDRLREQIALTVSELNQCRYCVSGHAAVGSSIGLTEDEVRDARTGTSPDRRTEAVLRFARRIVEERGRVSNDDIREVRNAGYGDAEIIEITAYVGLTIFSNYFNLVAQTEIDFPHVSEIEP